MAGYFVNSNGTPQKFLSRRERRALLKGLVSKPKTAEDVCKKAKATKQQSKKFVSALLDNQDILEMNKEAERNSNMLKNFVEKFGEEKGKELYLQNMELKTKSEEKKIKKENNFKKI